MACALCEKIRELISDAWRGLLRLRPTKTQTLKPDRIVDDERRKKPRVSLKTGDKKRSF